MSTGRRSWLDWYREYFVWDGKFSLRRPPLSRAEQELAGEEARNAQMTRLNFAATNTLPSKKAAE